MKENIETRLRDGYAHVQYLNFRLSRPVYVGRWDAESKQFIMDVFSVVHSKHDREVQRFTDLTQACVLWVKYPSEHTVKELRAGANEVVDELRNEECCAVLRKLLAENRLLRDDERRDLTQLVDEAEALTHQRRMTPS